MHAMIKFSSFSSSCLLRISVGQKGCKVVLGLEESTEDFRPLPLSTPVVMHLREFGHIFSLTEFASILEWEEDRRRLLEAFRFGTPPIVAPPPTPGDIMLENWLIDNEVSTGAAASIDTAENRTDGRLYAGKGYNSDGNQANLSSLELGCL
ncbi:hypothetical protein BJ878DRAFT_39166 [Calycina marina]|uniref:Uncharacterized protein n=1 Tax=Calycina marina TaxID=1763456 RepID=A0A9P7Z498_9HELO|nr:hypothetical protein BJ878DRAFT_39166 [Calycina marina]